MATAGDVINRALRLIGVAEAGEAASSEDADICLTALNDMLRDWERRGLSLGFSAASTIGATLDVPAHAIRAIAYNLAVEIAPEFSSPVPQNVFNEADRGYRRILRDAIGTPRSSVTHMPGSYGGWYDINSE